jgi:hypothetical protein
MEFGRFRVTVHRLVGAGNDIWFVSCDPFFNARQIGLPGDPLERMKALAVEMLVDELTKATEELGKCWK